MDDVDFSSKRECKIYTLYE